MSNDSKKFVDVLNYVFLCLSIIFLLFFIYLAFKVNPSFSKVYDSIGAPLSGFGKLALCINYFLIPGLILVVAKEWLKDNKLKLTINIAVLVVLILLMFVYIFSLFMPVVNMPQL